MIVVCKKATKKLVKGLRYEVQNLWNDGGNQRWLESKIEIKGIGRYSVDNFTDTDGKSLPKINFLTPRPVYRTLTFEELKEGDILVCTCDSYKTLAKDSMYRISKLITKSTDYRGYNGTIHQRVDKNVQFEGIKRAIKFSSWKFRKLSSEESREIQLSSILNGEKPPVIITSSARKIDLVTNKDRVLMNLLAKSILDSNRHHLSILEWAIQKVGNNYSITEEDYKSLLNLSLKEVLEKLK
jgi:hypothetical protein